MPAPYDTIVIGMGASGTSAASTLAAAGKKVLALEAQGRIGGRVNTVPFGDGVVELGAEWIHGTSPSTVYDLAIKHNVSLLPQDLTFRTYQSDGTFKHEDLVNELIVYSLGVIEEPPAVPEPLGEFISRKVREYLKAKHPSVANDEEFITEFFQFMDLIIDNYESSNSWNDVTTASNYEELDGHQHMSWHSLGYKTLFEILLLQVSSLIIDNYESSNSWNDVTTASNYEELDGHQHMSWHSLGYKTLFEILLNTYNNGPGYPNLEIKLNTEVTKIQWPQEPADNVVVTVKDGTTYTAKTAIVTVSIGVLKERLTTLFSPQLPVKKSNPIKNTSIGVVNKIVLLFDKPFWPEDRVFFGFLWIKEDRLKVPSKDWWTTKIFGASCPKGNKKVLTVWTSGDGAKLVETLPEDLVKTKVMGVIRKFMGADKNIPDPVGILRSAWYSNPFTRGSYTYDNLQTPQHPTSRTDLAEPLLDSAGQPRLLFAGEATESRHFSTVHGAVDSGRREAARLLRTQSKI